MNKKAQARLLKKPPPEFVNAEVTAGDLPYAEFRTLEFILAAYAAANNIALPKVDGQSLQQRDCTDIQGDRNQLPIPSAFVDAPSEKSNDEEGENDDEPDLELKKKK